MRFMDVLVMAYLTRGATAELQFAISVLWREVTIGNYVPRVTWIMNKHWLIGQATMPMRNLTLNRVRSLMKSFGQTRKCWIDSAVCSTASGETVTAVLFETLRDSGYRQGPHQRHRGKNLTSDDASCDKFG